MNIVILAIIICSLFSQKAWSDACEHRQASLLIENDSALTLGGGTDRFYSNGFEVSFSCQPSLNQQRTRQANLAYRSLNWIHNDSDIIWVKNGIKLGQKIYTASDLSLVPENIDLDRDRPYAGWSYVSIFYEAETLQDRYLKHEFSIGCVGPCSQADNIQKEWHELFGFTHPEGWDLQIKNQLALQYFAEFKTNRHEVFPFVSLHPRYKLSLGTVFNDFSFGGEFIIGDKSNSITHPESFRDRKWDWQLFLHNDIQLVAFNGTLEGSLFNHRSPHTVKPSRVVLENGIGLRLNYDNRYHFEYRFVGKSTENEEQDWKFWDHKYGSFKFGFGF